MTGINKLMKLLRKKIHLKKKKPNSKNSLITSNDIEIDKSKWGDGEWQSESDFCYRSRLGFGEVIIRHPEMGHLLGYIGVEKGHPLYGKHYDELYDYDFNDFDLSIHGGWTYSSAPVKKWNGEGCYPRNPNYPAGEPNNYWWFGFDCAHYQDLVPAMEVKLREIMPAEHFEAKDNDPDYLKTTYKDWLFVEMELFRAWNAINWMNNSKKFAVNAGRILYLSYFFICFQLWVLDFNEPWWGWTLDLVTIGIWLGVIKMNWIMWRKHSLALRWRSE